MRLQRDFEPIVYSNGPVFRSADDDLYQHVYKNIKVIDTTGICQVHTNKTMSVAFCTSDFGGPPNYLLFQMRLCIGELSALDLTLMFTKTMVFCYQNCSDLL